MRRRAGVARRPRPSERVKTRGADVQPPVDLAMLKEVPGEALVIGTNGSENNRVGHASSVLSLIEKMNLVKRFGPTLRPATELRRRVRRTQCHALLWLSALALVASCQSRLAGGALPAQAASGPRRVILIVGDGTGLAHWSAAALSQKEPLAVSRLPAVGLVDTRCACTRTTDSGASATAYATGVRTQYTYISVTPDSIPLRTVLEEAEAKGMSTGLVTTTEITDATPAAFAAHVPYRYQRMEIARQMASKNIEVLLGGGRVYFSSRPDGVDLLQGLAGRQYTRVSTPTEFRALDLSRVDRLIGLFADSTIFPATHLRPTLPEMAETALQILDRDPDGFFLLLESEDTDDTSHDNLGIEAHNASIAELDRAVAVALAYQRRRPETLVVVIGDHETGELTLQVRRDSTVLEYHTTGHSAVLVPVFAGGPGAEGFGRWLRNDEVGQLLFRAVGVEPPNSR